MFACVGRGPLAAAAQRRQRRRRRLSSDVFHMLQRGVFQRIARAIPSRCMSTTAVRAHELPQTQVPKDLPRGTVVPGDKVDPQLGDYPAMPFQNQQFRPYSRHWWDTQDRRQYGETLHEQDDVLNMWSPDAYKTPGPLALRHFLMAVAAIGAFSLLVYKNSFQPPMMRKTFPRDGLADELGGAQAAARTEQDLEEREDEE